MSQFVILSRPADHHAISVTQQYYAAVTLRATATQYADANVV